MRNRCTRASGFVRTFLKIEYAVISVVRNSPRGKRCFQRSIVYSVDTSDKISFLGMSTKTLFTPSIRRSVRTGVGQTAIPLWTMCPFPRGEGSLAKFVIRAIWKSSNQKFVKCVSKFNLLLCLRRSNSRRIRYFPRRELTLQPSGVTVGTMSILAK